MTNKMDQHACLPQLLERRAATEPDRVFIHEVDTGASYTYAQIDCEVKKWRRVFVGLGVAETEPVLIMMPTCAETVFVWAALAWLRAIAIPINTDYRGRILAHALENSFARIAVVAKEHVGQIAAAKSDGDELSVLVIPDAVDPGDVSTPLFRSLARDEIESLGASSPEPSVEGPRVRDISAVVYTSGTTGPSKGVMMPWRQLHDTVNAFFPEGVPSKGDVLYVPFPMFHLTGIGPVYLAALVGGSVVLRRRFKTDEYWDDVEALGCTTTLMIGAMTDFLLDAPVRPGDQDGPLRDVMMMPLNHRIDEFEQRFGVRVCTLFGMTEVGVPVVHGWHRDRVGACGKLRNGYTVRLVDEDDNDVPAGQAGELVARTDEPWTMSAGYWRMPEATAAAWRNQWLHTGDALRCDEDGYFYFVDRVKDTIRRRGENISSLELEREILDHPAVAEVAAIGVRGDWLEDEVKVFVVLRPGTALGGDELVAFLASRVPGFMVPRFFEIVDDLPRTPTGKVKKQELRQLAHDERTWDRAQTPG